MLYKLYDLLWNYEDPDEFARVEIMRSAKRGLVIITGTFIIVMALLAAFHITVNILPSK